MPHFGTVQDESLEPASDLGDALEFMQLWWAVEHSMHRVSKRMEMDYGVTVPQRLVLAIVDRFPGTAAGRLAQILHVHPSTLTGILRRMEQRGYLRRRSDPSDARKIRLSLSAKGSQLHQRLDSVEDAFHRVLCSLGGDEQELLKRSLRMLATELSASTEAADLSSDC